MIKIGIGTCQTSNLAAIQHLNGHMIFFFSLIDKEEQATDEWRFHRRLKRSTYLDTGSGENEPVSGPGSSPEALDPELFYWFNVIGQYASTEEVSLLLYAR